MRLSPKYRDKDSAFVAEDIEQQIRDSGDGDVNFRRFIRTYAIWLNVIVDMATLILSNPATKDADEYYLLHSLVYFMTRKIAED